MEDIDFRFGTREKVEKFLTKKCAENLPNGELKMSIRDRRRFGVTFFSVLRAAKELAQNPEFEPKSNDDFSEAILAKIVGRSLPEAREAMPEVDWNSLLEFIMAILPVIFQILALF